MLPGFRRSIVWSTVGLSAQVLTALPVLGGDGEKSAPLPTKPEVAVRHWTHDDGLPQDSVTCLERTPDGFLWVGTFGGLARFDGAGFRALTLDETEGLPSNRITSLESGAKGRLWIGTQDEGVASLLEGRFERYAEARGLGTIRALLEDSAGRVWVGGEAGLGMVAGQRFEALAPKELWDLKLDSAGLAWGLSPGVVLALGEEVDEFGSCPPEHTSIEIDADGTVWTFGDEGYAHVTEDGYREFEYGNATREKQTEIDSQGRLLMCVKGALEVFARDAEGGWGFISSTPLPPEFGESVRVIFSDADGRVWVGGNGTGLALLAPTPLVRLGQESGLVVGPRSLVTNGKTIVFEFSTPHFGQSDGRELSLRPWESGAPQKLLAVTSDDARWIWDEDQVLCISGGEVTHRVPTPTTPTGAVESRTGALWLGGEARLTRWMDGSPEVFPVYTRSAVRPCFEDERGRIHFLVQGGVGRLENGQAEIEYAGELARGTWRSMVADGTGTFWITTYGSGLVRYRNGEFRQLAADQGLPDLSLGGILCTGDRLWINSNSGVLVARIEALEAALEPDARPAAVRRLSSDEGNGPDAAADAQGRLWFPTTTGITIIDPALVQPRETALVVSLERLVMDRVEANDLEGMVEVPAGVHNLELHYTAVSFEDPDQLEFRYRLSDYQDEWVDAGPRRIAYFTGVPPGVHRFEVVAVNSDGIESAVPLALNLNLLPLMHQTWWFRWGAAACALGLVVGVFRWRVRTIRRHNAVLQREIDERERVEAERRQLEETLRESKRLESIGRLAGGVAHDFNNVLTVILGRSHLIAEHPGVSDDVELSEHVEDLEECGQRAARLTRQLLAFSGRQVLHPRIVDPNGVVRELEPMLRQLIPADITFEIELPDVGCVEVDPSQLERVIMNLVLNARDAMPSGGTLTVSSRRVEAPGLEPSEVCLAVADTGHGIRDEDRPHLFEPFFTTKEADRGTGLGLASVHGIVQQSGGRIRVHSAVGLGTTFEVLLPFVETDPAAARARAAQAPEAADDGSPQAIAASVTILVCEDDSSVKRTVRLYLEQQGYRVHTADRPSNALAVARRLDHIDLLVTDVVMPGDSGVALAEAIQTLRPGLPVLFISGYTKQHLLESKFQVATAAFLAKPFTSEELYDAVSTLLIRARAAQPS